MHPQTGAAAITTSGGSFSGHYSGTFTLTECSSTATGSFSFNGSGHASFIHGPVTIVSALHPHNSMTVLLQSVGFGGQPCGSKMDFQFDGGSGRFALATGSGTHKFSLPCGQSSGTFTDEWTGTLTF